MLKVPSEIQAAQIKEKLVRISDENLDRKFYDEIWGRYPNIYRAIIGVIDTPAWRQPITIACAVFLAGLEEVNERSLKDLSESDALILLSEFKLTGQVGMKQDIHIFSTWLLEYIIPMLLAQVDKAERTDLYQIQGAEALSIMCCAILIAEGETCQDSTLL